MTSRRPEVLDPVVRAIVDAGGEAEAFAGDVTDREAMSGGEDHEASCLLDEDNDREAMCIDAPAGLRETWACIRTMAIGFGMLSKVCE